MGTLRARCEAEREHEIETEKSEVCLFQRCRLLMRLSGQR